jgi:hypothetical protein
VVETLAPNGSDQALRVRILSRAGWTRNNFSNTHAGDMAAERIIVDDIAIAQEPLRCGIVWKGLNHLLGRPHGGGMFRDVEVDYSAALVGEQDQYEQIRPIDRRSTSRPVSMGDPLRRSDMLLRLSCQKPFTSNGSPARTATHSAPFKRTRPRSPKRCAPQLRVYPGS